MVWEDYEYSALDIWITFLDIFLVLLIMVPAAFIALERAAKTFLKISPFMFCELGVL